MNLVNKLNLPSFPNHECKYKYKYRKGKWGVRLRICA